MHVISIKPLAEVPETMPLIQAWFEGEWPDYYGVGARGDARRDLVEYSNTDSLPTGLVAFVQGVPSGFAAIKSKPPASHPHLGPWVGEAYVVPSQRRQSVGQVLLQALEAEARRLGFARLYCASATSDALMRRAGWRPLKAAPREAALKEAALQETVPQDAPRTGIYERAL